MIMVESGNSYMKCFGDHVKYVNGKGEPHRVNGPAIICDYGYEAWWVDGNLHRADGPAVVYDDVEQWWVDGELHREDGPAVVWNNGREEYWVNDRRMEPFTVEEKQ